MGRWSFIKAPFKDFFHSSYIEMKTNALLSNKSFPAISSASRTVPALEKHTTREVETLQAVLRQRETYYSKILQQSTK